MNLYKIKLDELIQTDLFRRLKIFLYDFKTYPSYINDRLSLMSNINPQFFMSLYYFTEEEIEYLLNFETSDGFTLKKCIEYQLNEKSDIGIICSSHDIYPIFTNVFNLKLGFDRNLKKESKKFKSIHNI